MTAMTQKQRMITALTLGVPDRVPTFELEFQLSEELCGRPFLSRRELEGTSRPQRAQLLRESAEYLLKVFGILEHDAFTVPYFDDETAYEIIQDIRDLSGDDYMLVMHGDGTYAIPDGKGMMEFVLRIADDPQGVHDTAKRMRDDAIARNRKMRGYGIDGFILCADYCFNAGPFLSPQMFREFVTPYLKGIIDEIRADGGYAIKHTDGDIMPILDQLVEANPHALHSLDPMAGVDIKLVKVMYGDQVALCGNVHCAAMQTGTEEEVIASCEYCLTYAKPGGGYVYTTSNVPFRGLPLERYQLVLDVWRRMRDY